MPFRAWIVTGLLLHGTGTVGAADWPAFRGIDGSGIAHETRVPTSWGPATNIQWKVKLPAPGNSSPIVSNGRVFVTGATDKGKRRGLYCFDRSDGKQLWVRIVKFDQVEWTHDTNPYCASTPVADGERVVVWHGTAGLFCYDFDGRELWARDLGEFRHVYGYASSPILHRDKVILNFGPGVRTFLTAVDLKTGRVLWKTDEPGGNSIRQPKIIGSFSTPVLARVGGKEQVLCSMPRRLVAYDPETGVILWFCEGIPNSELDLVYTSPVVAGDIGVSMAGFRGTAMAVKLGGSGNVTSINRLWANTKHQPERIGTGVVVGKYLYVANAGPSTAQCLELDTGKEMWHERLPGGDQGGLCWGSVVCAGGRLYVTNQSGTTNVFLPNPKKLQLIASNRLGESSNSTPAVSEGQIFLRTAKHLYCIGNQ